MAHFQRLWNQRCLRPNALMSVSGEGPVMMTLTDMTAKKKPEPCAQEIAARELFRLAQEQGLSLTGPDGCRDMRQF